MTLARVRAFLIPFALGAGLSAALPVFGSGNNAGNGPASSPAPLAPKLTPDEMIRIEIGIDPTGNGGNGGNGGNANNGSNAGPRRRHGGGNNLSCDCGDDAAVQRLRQRVYQLERAVRQLQDIALSTPQPVPAQPSQPYTCYMQRFGKTYTGKGGSEIEARAAALESCSRAGHLACDEDDLKCGR